MNKWPATTKIQEIFNKFLFDEDNGVVLLHSHVRSSEIQYDAYNVDLKYTVLDFEEISKIDKELREIGYRIKYVYSQSLEITHDENTITIENIKFSLRILPITVIKKGYCIHCKNFIKDNENDKRCSCKAKKGYITQNAHRKLACKDYDEMPDKCKGCHDRGKCDLDYDKTSSCWVFGQNWRTELEVQKKTEDSQ